MGTSAAVVQAYCPLCGSPVLSVGRGGRVLSEDIRQDRFSLSKGHGYGLCDDCAVLADLPEDLTLN